MTSEVAAQHVFGDWLRVHRKRLDLTREQLAEKVGCSAATIRKLEAEERRPSPQIADRFADVFDIPVTERGRFLRFARGDWTAAPASGHQKQVSLWSGTSPTIRANLPSPASSLVGREDDIAAVCRLLTDGEVRLLTLIGPPGVGKTRLSIASAVGMLAAFSGSVAFVALAPLVGTGLVASTIIEGLGFIETRRLPAKEQLIDAIGNTQLLLILDNCEHVIEETSALAHELLVACPALKILLTSREALRIPGEWLYPVPPLAFPQSGVILTTIEPPTFPALALFEQRARAVRPDFRIDARNVEDVAAICRQLDGLPLAIEIVASRIRMMDPQVLRERLDDRYVLSANGMRAVPLRQKTLQSAINWSYSLLSDDEKRAFAYLSVFAGGFTLEAAEAILAELVLDRPVLDLLAAFVDKSLLQRLATVKDVRFGMLVTIQQYALHALREADSEAAPRERHLTYFTQMAEEGARHLRGPQQVEWAERLALETDNFRAALEWSLSGGQTRAALRLLGALGWSWEMQARYREALDWLERIRSLPAVADYPLEYVTVLNHVGRQSWAHNQVDVGRALLEESRAVSSDLGEEGEPALGAALNWLGLIVLLSDRDLVGSRHLFEKGLDLFRKWDDSHGVALSRFHLGILEMDLSRFDLARSLFEQSLAVFRQIGDLFFMSRVSVYLGRLFLKQGDYEHARWHFEEHLRIDEKLGFWLGVADGWSDLGDLFSTMGQNVPAGAHYEASVRVCEEHHLDAPDVYWGSAMMALANSDYLLAERRFTDYYRKLHATAGTSSEALLLAGLAAAAAGRGEMERAAQLSGAAEEAMTEAASVQARDLTHYLEPARAILGCERFDALRAEGRAMTTEQAIASAFGELTFKGR